MIQSQEALAKRSADWQAVALILKIETPRALANLRNIVVEAAGRQPTAIMVAPGDLAVEIAFTKLAEMQEEILWLAGAAQLPVIWATQVLDHLIRKGVPSRGEMTDAAMVARAECVMLNKGLYSWRRSACWIRCSAGWTLTLLSVADQTIPAPLRPDPSASAPKLRSYRE